MGKGLSGQQVSFSGRLLWWPGTESNRRRQPFQGHLPIPLRGNGISGFIDVTEVVLDLGLCGISCAIFASSMFAYCSRLLGLVASKGGIQLKEAMAVTISDEILAAAHISEPEVKQELAVALYQQERLTLGQASRLAEMTQLAFQALLADRQIPIHYGVEEFREDVRTSRQPERF
jgi:predicted HTH domain antitoxin